MTEETKHRIMIFLACVRAELKNCDVEYCGKYGDWDDPSDERVADIANMLDAANGCPATVTEIAEAILCDAEIAS